jgi:hypothetical protein
VSVITITNAKPTAAEHTMQPANIKENSWRSLAACINCKAQATKPTTATTMVRPITAGQWELPAAAAITKLMETIETTLTNVYGPQRQAATQQVLLDLRHR